jgi:hypothetical protein
MELTFRKMALGAVLAVTACNGPVNPIGDVTVTVSASSSIIRGDETTLITTTFQNSGWRDAYIPSKSCGPMFGVMNENGEYLPLGPEACTLEALTPLRLAPGDRAQFTGTWNGRDRNGTRTPGDYRITAGVFGGNAVVVRVLE